MGKKNLAIIGIGEVPTGTYPGRSHWDIISFWKRNEIDHSASKWWRKKMNKKQCALVTGAASGTGLGDCKQPRSSHTGTKRFSADLLCIKTFCTCKVR